MDTDLQTTDTATINRGVARERGLLEPCPPPQSTTLKNFKRINTENVRKATQILHNF